jgi:hypothetical protein
VDVAQFGVNHVKYGVFMLCCDVFVYCSGYCVHLMNEWFI